MDEDFAEASRLLRIAGHPSLRLQAQQQAALRFIQMRRAGASDQELRRKLNSVIIEALVNIARR